MYVMYLQYHQKDVDYEASMKELNEQNKSYEDIIDEHKATIKKVKHIETIWLAIYLIIARIYVCVHP